MKREKREEGKKRGKENGGKKRRYIQKTQQWKEKIEIGLHYFSIWLQLDARKLQKPRCGRAGKVR